MPEGTPSKAPRRHLKKGNNIEIGRTTGSCSVNPVKREPEILSSPCGDAMQVN